MDFGLNGQLYRKGFASEFHMNVKLCADRRRWFMKKDVNATLLVIIFSLYSGPQVKDT